MKEHVLDITLTLRGPILVKGSGPGGFGIDAPVARVAFGPDKDKPFLPGTLIKGKVAEALQQLAALDGRVKLKRFSEEWLGQKSRGENDEGSNDPYRGRLHFEDFVAASPEAPGQRHRIKIDAETGSVTRQALQVMETPFAPGREVAFQGQARFFGDEATATEVERHMRLGLSWLTQVGASRTVGFGRLLRVCVSRSAGRLVKAASKPKNISGLRLVIRPFEALCVSKHKIGDNLFESERVIPGNMLAGAVAETWASLLGERLKTGDVAELEARDPSRALLAKHFSQIRFRHAFPAPAAARQRPKAIPLSVASVGDIAGAPACRDLVEHPEPVIFETDFGWNAPSFHNGWKPGEHEHIDPAYGWAFPATELRVRTAIDSGKRRSHRGDPAQGIGGKLFAWEVVHPWTSQGEEVVWHSVIDLHGIPENDRAAVLEQLAPLLNVLSFVSKTKTACETAVSQMVENETSVPELKEGDLVRLVLQTPALLCDPRFQKEVKVVREGTEVPVRPGGALESDEMRALYAETWRELSKPSPEAEASMELSHYFASQPLAGGNYLRRRFQKGRPYNPWLLTDAESVFVLKVNNTETARERLGEWLRAGLPLPGWAEKAFGSNWKTNPFIRQNGFGEVALHEINSDAPLPKKGEFEIIK